MTESTAPEPDNIEQFSHAQFMEAAERLAAGLERTAAKVRLAASSFIADREMPHTKLAARIQSDVLWDLANYSLENLASHAAAADVAALHK